jgi:hypothetical protein
MPQREIGEMPQRGGDGRRQKRTEGVIYLALGL